MKKFLLGTVALVAMAATVPAFAADLGARTYTKAPAYVAAPIYNWTGFYIGGHVGGAFVGDDSIGTGATRSSDGTFLGGVQGGYDYQFAPNWVLGVEAQYSWLDQGTDPVVVGGVYSFSDKQKGLGSVTGRIGYTWGPALLYVKGGYAFADYDTTVTIVGTGAAAGVSSKSDGYTVGGGLEYLFTQNWSGKIEYQYYNFGNTSFITPGLVVGGFTNDVHSVKAGLNYRFNLGGAPLLAKY
ncbi:MAG TPA: outer membrane protein [Rhodopseudomonas sp.]|uniref:outer membrane protein n=1 Tax=Rhodopseudomonas sp. TaxID=1078 RepID=UPI002ED8A0CC